jgi:hypothetical protein
VTNGRNREVPRADSFFLNAHNNTGRSISIIKDIPNVDTPRVLLVATTLVHPLLRWQSCFLASVRGAHLESRIISGTGKTRAGKKIYLSPTLPFLT